MVLSTPELITSLQGDIRIVLGLAGKVDSTSRDYRPTEGLSFMNLWSGVDAAAAP